MGMLYLLEAVRQLDSIKTVINITSDKCYEKKNWDGAYHENEPIGGLDHYSNSKGYLELVTAAYRHSFFNAKKGILEIVTARAGNVIGGGD
ncbi:NAD-dependent epimerase/dehydratase family protein [Candidatus Williamhamiltonella defendens]|uniref:NAD-dependent epimerase/dehydratase family protein n=1 Tax=Candidatus Williamhamiltonella defendens TaxID=138072 RepID=UPI001F180399|nr:NAD-dependent epimerase/dehydratase family protein [Candidatus Hamiltonella defensa]